MTIFGYSKRVVNEHGLHELTEVTFDVSLADLRRIAAFLLRVQIVGSPASGIPATVT